MSTTISHVFPVRFTILATLLFVAAIASTNSAQAADVVYRQPMGNAGEIVFYSSGHYRITNHTTTDLYYRFRIVPKTKSGFQGNVSESFCYGSSRTRPINYIYARGGRIERVIVYRIGPVR